MAVKGKHKRIAYEKEVIFRRIAELYFFLDELNPFFVVEDEEELILGEDDGIALDVSIEGADDTTEELSMIEALDDAQDLFRERLFDRLFWLFDGFAAPFYEHAGLRKEFEDFTRQEYGAAIVLKPPKRKPRLTLVPTDHTKK